MNIKRYEDIIKLTRTQKRLIKELFYSWDWKLCIDGEERMRLCLTELNQPHYNIVNRLFYTEKENLIYKYLTELSLLYDIEKHRYGEQGN